MQTEILSCNYSYHNQPFPSYRYALSSYLIRLQTEGFSHALVEGKMRRIEAGDLLLYKPGDQYELRIEQHNNAPVVSGDYYLFCQGDWISSWWDRYPKSQLTSIDVNETLLFSWRQIILENRRGSEKNSELSGYLLRSLCLYIDQACKESGFLPIRPYSASRMKRYIEEHATNAFKVEDVARHVQLSVSRAAHLFKASYGESIMQYALKVRLAIAVERMIYSTFTLEHIAEGCGLGSYPYFHRVFKERYGATPKKYRSNLQIRN